MFYLLYRHQCNTKPFHFHIFLLRMVRFIMWPWYRDISACEDDMYFHNGMSLAFYGQVLI